MPLPRDVLEILPAQIADAEREVEVQTAPYRGGVAVGDATAVAPAVAKVPLAAPLKVVGKQQAVDTHVVAGKRLAAVAQPAAHLEVAAVDAVVAVAVVVLEPRVHPVARYGPAAAQVELQTEVGDDEHVVQQVGLHGHVERLALAGRGHGKPHGVRAPHHEGVGTNGGHRVSPHHDHRVSPLFGVDALVPDLEHRRAQFGEEALFHVAPRAPSPQQGQPALATVSHDAALRDPFGRVAQEIERFGAKRHAGVGLGQKDEPLPVYPGGGGEHGDVPAREAFADVAAEPPRALFGQRLVKGGASLGRSTRYHAYAAHAAGGVGEQRLQPQGEGVELAAVAAEGGVEERLALAEMDADGVATPPDAGFLPAGMAEKEQEKQENNRSFHCL